MTERKSAGEYTPATKERTASTDDSYETGTDDRQSLPSSDRPSGYTYASPKTPGGTAITDARVTTVYDALREYLSEHPLSTSVTSADLVDGCQYTQSTIGRALRKLADDDGCPIALTLWSAPGGNNRARYTVQRESVGAGDE